MVVSDFCTLYVLLEDAYVVYFDVYFYVTAKKLAVFFVIGEALSCRTALNKNS